MKMDLKMVHNKILLLLLFQFLCYLIISISAQEFDVRRHLCTVTRYDAAKGAANNGTVSANIPDGCTPVHLNLVARHGTRLPTKKRLKELNELAHDLQVLVNDAKQDSKNSPSSLVKIPAWLQGWQSPWKGKTGGQLISEGEIELSNLGINIKRKFKDLLDERYDPKVFTIKATNVSRVLDSAKAFSRGLFTGGNILGQDDFTVIAENCENDVMLRFFDHCETYKQYREKNKAEVEKRKETVLDEISSSLASRYQLKFTRKNVASLWFLCKQEASLLGIINQACGLFTPSEVLLLEWTDDLEVFLLKGYGNRVNYLMGVPLLRDVIQSMKNAIRAKEENAAPGTYETANLRFAHAETVIPFSCLLGLFLEGPDLERLKQELPLEPPPKPPQRRNWRGSLMAPFAANNMLVLYDCPANNANNYYVQVLHNEVPVPLPGCGDSDFCPFETFKEKIFRPHEMHFQNFICTGKLHELHPNYKFCRLASPSMCEVVSKPFRTNMEILYSMIMSKNQDIER